MAAPFDYTKLIASKATVGSIKYWVNHEVIDPEQIVAEAEAFIYQRLRAREMQVSDSVVGVVNQAYIELPTGFLDPIELKFDGYGDELEYVHETLLNRVYDSDGTFQSGQPARWAIFDERIQFDVPVSSDLIPFTGRLIYYKTPTALSALNATNFLTNRFPTLLRRACLAFGYEARNRTDMMTTELQLVEAAITDANRSADMSRRGQTLR